MNFENVIDPVELDEWINQNKSFQLVDITEEKILEAFENEFTWLPASKLLSQIHLLRKDVPVVLCCQHGESSFIIMNIIQLQFNLLNIYSLKTGLNGWKGINNSNCICDVG